MDKKYNRENQRQLELQPGLEIWKIQTNALIEQELNARTMNIQMFQRLAKTIGKGNRLESLPFCALTNSGVEIISGHHRVRAAISAGLKELFVIVDTTGLTKSEIKAKQLAHNSISGEDDKSILKEIYTQITDNESREESYLEIGDVKFEKADIDVNLKPETEIVVLAFTPNAFAAWEDLIAQCPPATKEIALAEENQSKALRVVIQRVGEKYDVRQVGRAIEKLIEVGNG